MLELHPGWRRRRHPEPPARDGAGRGRAQTRRATSCGCSTRSAAAAARDVDEIARRSGLAVTDVVGVLGALDLDERVLQRGSGWIRGEVIAARRR